MPLIVTGMAMEAALFGGASADVIIGAGDAAALAAKIEAALKRRPQPLLSFGVAGGLAPGLAAGTLVIADAVWADTARMPCDREWAARLRGPCLAGDIAAQDLPVASAAAKAALHAATGALAADMESHVVAQAALRHALPFAAIRAIADPAWRDLPPAALVPMRADGKPNLPAVLAALARRPGQIGALIALAGDLRRAMRALRAVAAQIN